jgi:SAM-dependent methyltransferase
MLTSCVCKRADFDAPWFPPSGRLHRKDWEYAVITQALRERGMLEPRRSGLGFAVGNEPLSRQFAARGVDVLATDAPDGGAWGASGQHAGAGDGIAGEGVRFRHVDMRRPEQFPDERFDFVWSSCAMEHLGNLQAGLDFVRASSRLLVPGGVAAHTTEYNVSSDDDTVSAGGYVLYRRQDFEALARYLRPGFELLQFDPDPGDRPEDLEPDVEPWYTTGREHVKLVLSGFVATSALLLVRRVL